MRGRRLLASICALALGLALLAWLLGGREHDRLADEPERQARTPPAAAAPAEVDVLAVSADEHAAAQQRSLLPGAALGRIAGRVHRVDGRPVAGAQVLAARSEDVSLAPEEWLDAAQRRVDESAALPFALARTDATGHFVFASLAAGAYVLFAGENLERGGESRTCCGVHATGEEELDLVLDEFVLEVELGGTSDPRFPGLFGCRLVDEDSRDWLGSAYARNWGGQYAAFEDVQPGRLYRASWSSALGLSTSLDVRIEPDRRVTHVVLVAPRSADPGRAAFVVRSPEGLRWRECSVRVENAAGELVFSDNGPSVDELELAPGSYTVRAEPIGTRRVADRAAASLAPARRSFRVWSGEREEVALEFPRAGALELTLLAAGAEAPGASPAAPAGAALEELDEGELARRGDEQDLRLGTSSWAAVPCALVDAQGRRERLEFRARGKGEGRGTQHGGALVGQGFLASQRLAPGRYTLEVRHAGATHVLGELAIESGKLTRARFVLP